MSSNSPPREVGGAQSDALVVRAMDRVLESERAAQAALAECERECDQMLERWKRSERARSPAGSRRLTLLVTVMPSRGRSGSNGGAMSKVSRRGIPMNGNRG
jgi:hypothetical protein